MTRAKSNYGLSLLAAWSKMTQGFDRRVPREVVAPVYDAPVRNRLRRQKYRRKKRRGPPPRVKPKPERQVRFAEAVPAGKPRPNSRKKRRARLAAMRAGASSTFASPLLAQQVLNEPGSREARSRLRETLHRGPLRPAEIWDEITGRAARRGQPVWKNNPGGFADVYS